VKWKFNTVGKNRVAVLGKIPAGYEESVYCRNWKVCSDDKERMEFRCPRCGGLAKVIKLKFGFIASKFPAQVFLLWCRGCKLKGQRKVYMGLTMKKGVVADDEKGVEKQV